MKRNQLLALVLFISMCLMLSSEVSAQTTTAIPNYYVMAEGEFTYIDVYRVTTSEGSEYETACCHVTTEYVKTEFTSLRTNYNSWKFRVYVYSNNNQTSFDVNIIKGTRMTIDAANDISITFSMNEGANTVNLDDTFLVFVLAIGGTGATVVVILIVFLLKSDY